jgi:hypothetical protein
MKFIQALKKTNRHHMANAIYKPGDQVPQSGIYKVVHDSNHIREHEVTSVMGEHFPPCNNCGQHPRFELVRAAHHIGNHESFK